MALALVALGSRAEAQTITGSNATLANGELRRPRIERPFVAWTDTSGANEGVVRYFDERDASTHTIGFGQDPDVGGGKIAYTRSGDVHVFDPASGTDTNVTHDSAQQQSASISAHLLGWAVFDPSTGFNGASVVRNLDTGETTSLPHTFVPSAPIVRGTHALYLDMDESARQTQTLMLFDAATKTTRALATGSFLSFDLDDAHVVAVMEAPAPTWVVLFDFTGAQVGTIAPPSTGSRRSASVSGEWVAIESEVTTDGSLELWHWTTNELFTTNAGRSSTVHLPQIDGRRVVYDDGNAGFTPTGIFAFDFTAPQALPSVFSDNFDACTSTSDLGSNWSIHGTWYCKSGRARGESTTLGRAFAKTAQLGDTRVQALVQLNNSDGSGIIARASTIGFYSLRIFKAGEVRLSRFVDGTETVLGRAQATILDTTSYNLGLEVRGNAELTATLNGTVVLFVDDSSTTALVSGVSGLLHGQGFRTQFDNFTLRGFLPGVPRFSLSDNFDDCTSTTGLDFPWTTDGIWYCRSGRARGETANGLALPVGLPMGNDQTVQARVQLTGSASGSGVVARQYGHGHYAAILRPGRVEIVRDLDGSRTVLASVPASISIEPSSYVVKLQVQGVTPVTLKMFVNGSQLASATDSSGDRLQFGTTGLLSGSDARTQFDDFVTTGP